MKNQQWLVFLFVLVAATLTVTIVSAQGPKQTPPKPKLPASNTGTAFTYQGQLKQSGALVNGSCDFQFGLWDSLSGGTLVTNTLTQTVSSLSVTNGLFTTPIDFGSSVYAFNGDARWLAIAVNCGSGLTALSPRESVSPEPYALTALYTAYKNVLVVTTSGGHYNSITAALNAISDNSATNRYLIFVAPGTYTETVTMKPYVDIEGAGELTTKITWVGSPPANTGTVIGANNAELRFLTVENTGGNTYAVAIYNGSASPRFTHITATSLGGSFNFGVYNDSSSPTIDASRLTAIGASLNYGIINFATSGTFTVTVNDSQVKGSSYTVYNDSHFTTLIGASKLDGGAVFANGGTVTCVFVYDAAYTGYTSVCP